MTTIKASSTAARRARALALVSLAALPFAVPASAAAHGLVGKQDLPVPSWLFGWAAGVVLIASFVGLATLWPTPRLQDVEGRAVWRVPRAVEIFGGLAGVMAFAGLIYAGFAGVQNDNENILPTVVFVIFWVGLPFASLLFGDVFSLVNPWRAIGRAAGWVVARTSAQPEPLPYPERLGRWPAAIGLLAFPWLELVYVDRDVPEKLAIAGLVYAAIQLVGMALYGERAWLRNGDAFGVFFAFLGRLGVIEWRRGTLLVRKPLTGVTRIDPRPGTAALVCIAIGTTSFDGFSNGNLWYSFNADVTQWFVDRGLSAADGLTILYSAGLFGAVVLVSALYRLGIKGIARIDPDRGPHELSRLFAHSLIPIALAYLIAHYFSLIAFQGQAIVRLLSDPLGDGSDLLGGAGTQIDYTWISATGVWYVQVAALVIGHVAGLILAHDKAVSLYEDPKVATRTQYWMLGVMVTFTSLALFLLSDAAQ